MRLARLSGRVGPPWRRGVRWGATVSLAGRGRRGKRQPPSRRPGRRARRRDRVGGCGDAEDLAAVGEHVSQRRGFCGLLAGLAAAVRIPTPEAARPWPLHEHVNVRLHPKQAAQALTFIIHPAARVTVRSRPRTFVRCALAPQILPIAIGDAPIERARRLMPVAAGDPTRYRLAPWRCGI